MEIQDSQSSAPARARLIVGVSLVLGVFFDYFFFEKVPGIAFPIYIILVLFGLYTIANYSKKQISKDVIWLLVPLMFFSIMVFVRSSILLTFLNVAASLLLLLLISEVAFLGGRLRNFLVADYIKIFFLPFRFIRPLLQTLSDLFSLITINKDQRVFSRVVRGVFMTIPVLVVFLLLFSSADLIFQKYLSDLISFNIEEETVARAVLVLIATLIYIGAYSYSLKEREDQIILKQNNRDYNIGRVESSILLGSVNALFFIFILVQLTYLFGGESNISAQGFTYAEYARRGFFELITVALVSLLLLFVTEKFVVRGESQHTPGFKILGTLIVVQVILIMTSAFTRLSLYEEAYGFTTSRLYSHAFIVLLAVIFCLLLYKIHKDNREDTFGFRVFVSIILFLVAMNFLNPDAFIARKNIERYESTGRLDIYYLSSLSDDAINEKIKILGMRDEDLGKSFARELYWISKNNDPTHSSKWQSLNISRMRAEKVFSSKVSELEQYKDYKQYRTDLTTGSNNKTILSDADFISVVDPEGKVVARGDINNDGYEDAIVEQVNCGASCSVDLQIVFGDQNSVAKLFVPVEYGNFEPSYVGSSAVKSEITNISIKNGIISLTGKGLGCTPPETNKQCTQERWNLERTVTYRFNGREVVQLSIYPPHTD